MVSINYNPRTSVGSRWMSGFASKNPQSFGADKTRSQWSHVHLAVQKKRITIWKNFYRGRKFPDLPGQVPYYITRVDSGRSLDNLQERPRMGTYLENKKEKLTAFECADFQSIDSWKSTKLFPLEHRRWFPL